MKFSLLSLVSIANAERDGMQLVRSRELGRWGSLAKLFNNVRYIIQTVFACKMYPLDTFEPESDAQTPTNIWRTLHLDTTL
jgi:NADH:ubiquinone oxidoreductase subunit H